MMTSPIRTKTLLELLKAGFVVWKNALPQTMPFALLLAVANLVSQIIWHSGTLPEETSKSLYLGEFTFVFSSEHLGLSMLNVILLGLSLILDAALIDTIYHLINRKRVTFKTSLKRGYEKLLPFLAVKILCGVFLYGLILYAAILSKLGGYILLIVPSILAFSYLVFATYIVITSDLGILASLKESVKVVWGRWWYTFFVLLLFVLLSVVLLFLIFMVLMVVNIIFTLLAGALLGPLANYTTKYLSIVSQGIVIMILCPLWHALLLTLLAELQIRKIENSQYQDFKA